MKNYIKELREAREITQEVLAEKIGTTSQQIYNLEKGKRRLTWDWIQRLAVALECHPMEITEGPLGISMLQNDEKELLSAYRGLAEPERKIYLNMAKSYKSNDGQKKE